jgi:3-deoxy-manno-octulosonate cytidylyltransferase (CMP-KDO synthetase)
MKAFKDKNNVKVVIDNNNNALYFSREPIPSPWQGWKNIPRYMQTGIIAFRREMLYRFNAMQETPLEQIESVDMNRVLELGGEIKMVLTDSITLGVDTPEELFQAEKLLMKDMFVKYYLY